MSLASMAWETAQVRVTRTFLEVVEMCPAPEPRSRTMPALPSLGLDLDGEPASGYAVLAEPNFEEKHHEPDLDQNFSFGCTPILPETESELNSEMTPPPHWLAKGLHVRAEKEEFTPDYAFVAEPSADEKYHAVRVARTFLEVKPDVTDDEIASQQLRSYSMPILPSWLDVEKERDENSFGALVGHKASDPILRCDPILPETESELNSQMTPPPHWLGLHVRAEKEEFAPGYAFVAEQSADEKYHAVRVARTFLEVKPDVTDDEIASQQLRSYSMPILPSWLDVEKERDENSFGALVGHKASDPILRCDPILPETESELNSQMTPPPHWLGLHVRAEKEEFAPDYAFVAEPSFEGKYHESDQEQQFGMPILRNRELDVEKSSDAFVGQEASDPMLRCAPIFHPNLAEPTTGMPEPGKKMETQAMAPTPHWAEPLLPGLVVHPVHGDPNVDLKTWEEIDVELLAEEVETIANEDEPEDLKPVLQHADSHSGPFPLRMVEQHNNGRCFPCLFFTRTGDGCRKGDDCTHCHVCRPHEIRRRRNHIAAEMKAARKAAARRQLHGV